MSTITKRNQNWLPSIFNDWLGREWLEPRMTGGVTPAINVKETKTEYVVEVAAPGMCKDDFKVAVNDNGDMVITMERKGEEREENRDTQYLRREFSYTRFQQTMILPDDVECERIEATMDKGVLCITLPKKPEMTEHKIGRRIDIK
ncbi:MAG: Hsp20/alpha crystallin family protein [Rikenellaceae bacterium]|nr:Hsp20/alpha crystallin family protein [Rikenellaceae bacterium]